MKVLCVQLDGKLPNLALMRISAHHRERGDDVEFAYGAQFERGLWDAFDKVYGSVLFRKTIPLAERFLKVYPDGILGGTGVDPARENELVPLSPVIAKEVTRTEKYGITTNLVDFSHYPRFPQSIGFTQRGCRLNCSFCCVPVKEGKVRAVGTIPEIWRGGSHPRELLLLDNDFFGQPVWRDRIREIREGGFKVSFNQGINCRCITDEAAEAIASVDYRDDGMERKRIYTAWDSRGDDQRLFDGLCRLQKYGVKPAHMMVYMLIGYWPGETHADRDYRRRQLRKFGALPYPMPFVRTRELVGFQRWVIGAYDKPSTNWPWWPEGVPWEAWEAADYHPNALGVRDGKQLSAFSRADTPVRRADGEEPAA